MMECVIFSPGEYLTTEQLGAIQAKIQEWMQENLEDEWSCDWEFGGTIDKGPDFYLLISLSANDKIKFILKWG